MVTQFLWGVLMSETVRNIATVVGALYLLIKILGTLGCLCPFLKAYYLAPWGIFRTNFKKYGSWAVVTGASEGIGKGYATALAKRGLNVVILSRSEEKLEKVADEIINNVGMIYDPQYFLEVTPERLRSVIEINCQSMVQMTHLVLPKMVERKRGVVINLSSGASHFPVTLLTVYSATKVFVSYFSAGLRKEYGSKGIIVQNITPGYVATAMSGIQETSFMVPSSSSFANSALNTVGHLSSTSGCISHVLQEILLFHLLPRCVADYALMKMITSVQEKSLRRKAHQKRED